MASSTAPDRVITLSMEGDRLDDALRGARVGAPSAGEWPGTMDDPQLVLHARNGNPAALTALYQRFGGELLRLATRLTGSGADAEDLLHDLFVGLPELLARYEHRASLGPWLRGVMTRLAIGRMRLDGRRARLLEREHVAASVHGPSEVPRRLDASLDLDAALLALPEPARLLVVLHFVEGYSHGEIAALLEISSGAARVRSLRALRQLRALLER